MSLRSLSRKQLLLPLHRHIANTVSQPIFTHQQRYYNPIYDHLEKQNKNALPEETGIWIYPNERPGLEYATNWSLADLHIHPCFDSYRNADIEHLIKNAPYGHVDGKKHLIVEEFKTPSFDRFISTRYESETISQQKELPIRFQRRVHREIAYYLTYAYNSFVQDGAIGGYRVNHSLVRFVTDNSVTGLFLRNILHPIPLHNPNDFEHDSVILHAPGFRFTPPHIVEEFAGPSLEDLGISKEEFLMVNEKNNQILLSGITDTNVLLETLAYVGGKIAWSKGALFLPSDSVISNDGNVTLVIHSSTNSSIASSVLSNSNDYTVYGAHHNIWSKDGLSRAWNGVRATVSSLDGVSIREDDLVEKLEKGYRVTRRISRKQGDPMLPNLVKHPKNIIFAVHDPHYIIPSLGEVTSDQLKTLFGVGLKSVGKGQPSFAQALVESENFAPYANTTQIVDLFNELVTSSEAKLYIINSAYEAKDVSNVIKGINAGAKFSTNDKKKSKLWTSLTNEQIRDHEWKEEEKYTQSVKELVKRIEEQAKKLPKV